jgi:hypothetical protein
MFAMRLLRDADLVARASVFAAAGLERLWFAEDIVTKVLQCWPSSVIADVGTN